MVSPRPACARPMSSDASRASRSSSAISSNALAREVREGRAPDEALARSLRATFAHWSHADTVRLRQRTLRRLGLLHGDDDGSDE